MTMAFDASGFFVLRAPLLPFDTLEGLGADLEAPRALGRRAALEPCLAADRARVRDRLAELVTRVDVREALFLASPGLDEAVDRWRGDPESDKGRRIERALVRYVSRMAGRATPFGLFAGCAVGTLDRGTCLAVGDRSALRRHSRLDTDYLWTLAESVCRDAVRRDAVPLKPNPTLYAAADRLRYIEGKAGKDGRRYRLVAVDRTEAIDRVVASAAAGATSGSLAAAVIDDEVTLEEATEFIAKLTDAQVLVPDLEIAVTGPEPLGALGARLAPYAPAVAERLARVRYALEGIDEFGVGHPPSQYRRLAEALTDLPAKVELSRLFQVDLEIGSRSALGESVVAEIRRAVALIHRIAPPHPDEALTRFREAFEARYEGREVPLLDALDEEAGVGFGDGGEPSPLLRDFPSREPEPARVAWGDRERDLLELLGAALAEGREEIELDGALVERLSAGDRLPLPDAFAVSATLATDVNGTMSDGGLRVLVDAIDGPSGARLLGRFCHGDPRLLAHVEEHLRAEEALHPDWVFAEIAHLPEGRLGNILLRPVLREYEIPYLGCSGAPADRQIPLADLRVSVLNGEVVLRSARLGRRVVPRLTTAHNFRSGLGAYRFLCALQQQGVAAGVSWDWGPLAEAPFLPRVVSGRVILSRARWRVSQAELKALGKAREGTPGYRAVQAWRERRRLPRWVGLADWDNVLPLDLDNVLMVESFVQLVKDRDAAVLEELYPAPDALCAQGPDGRYVHQVVVPFVRTPSAGAPEAAGERSAPRASRTVRRSFAPGSEWLYLKLYAGAAAADQVLREAVAPVARWAIETGAADRWFFIRYGDPDWHLRVRFHGPGADPRGEIVRALRTVLEPFVADGRVRRLALDTYEREVERYGGPDGIVLAERVFHADSDAVLDVLHLLEPGDQGLDERWRVGLLGLDRLLGDLDLGPTERHALLRDARDGTARLLRLGPGLHRNLGARFREWRGELDALLDVHPESDHPFAESDGVLARRAARLRPVLAELRERERAGRLHAPLREIASSYLHMHVNRLMRSAPNEHELLLYDLLGRLYAAREHRVVAVGGAARQGGRWE